ncbi:LYR motif-containing protein 4 isoform X1 [Gallus gallus]|uniref:LYR motif-containing protein 4 isoform X1 n=1 Tax=Gallus gallus TaxID=9031 RepID=UPI000739C3E1|nr:LYR motif-containing protein 4 isoform X1 [Gallus gallus]XP_046767379.1 LYR motif-containing protein 4 isoform X1 [Gallus gallus]|eukprot:XP_015131378.1 LYR motif-containing protein 4 isoform X1 [Gallus gallus]
MAASSRAQVLRLYRALLRESQRFSGYNYRCCSSRRTYAIRRIRDAFRENKSIKDSEKIEELVNKAKENLEIIHRQSAVKLREGDSDPLPHKKEETRTEKG